MSVLPTPLTPSPAMPPEVRQAPERDGRVHVRQRRGQRDGVAVRGHDLHADQLRERPSEDVDARGEDVRAEEAVAVRAAAPGQPVEQAHQLLKQQLEFTGDHLEARDRENPDQRRRDQQKRRDEHRRDQTRVYVLDAEETHAVRLVQHGVAHRLLHGLGPAGGADENRRDQKHRHRRQPDHQLAPALLRHGLARFLFLLLFQDCAASSPLAGFTGPPPRSGAARYRPAALRPILNVSIANITLSAGFVLVFLRGYSGKKPD